jgi:hypothetical protein
MDRLGLVFLLTLGIGILISLLGSHANRAATVSKSIDLSSTNFETRSRFNIGGLIVSAVPASGRSPITRPFLSYDKMITGDWIKSRAKPKDDQPGPSEMF